jgi:hypothetical protein
MRELEFFSSFKMTLKIDFYSTRDMQKSHLLGIFTSNQKKLQKLKIKKQRFLNYHQSI